MLTLLGQFAADWRGGELVDSMTPKQRRVIEDTARSLVKTWAEDGVQPSVPLIFGMIQTAGIVSALQENDGPINQMLATLGSGAPPATTAALITMAMTALFLDGEFA